MRRSIVLLGAILFAIFLVLILLRFLLAAAFPSPVVAYMTLESGLPTVIVQDLHHNLKKRLDFEFFTEPSFSPDGARLALTSFLRFGSDIVTYDLSSGITLRLTDSLAIAETPAWSPDGEWIAFASNREGDNNIYIIRPDGSGRQRVTAHKAADRQPAWSPDGRQIVFASRRDGASAIYLLELETLTVTPLVVESRYDSLPKWTPDGRAVTFARSVDGLSQIMRLELETGDLSVMDLGEANADSLSWWRG